MGFDGQLDPFNDTAKSSHLSRASNSIPRARQASSHLALSPSVDPLQHEASIAQTLTLSSAGSLSAFVKSDVSTPLAASP